MSAGHNRPDSRLVLADHWKDYWKNEYSKLEHFVREFVGFPAFADHDWSDGGFALSHVEAQVLQCFLVVRGIVPELLHQRRILLHYLHCRDTGARSSRWRGPGQELASDLVVVVSGQVRRRDSDP